MKCQEKLDQKLELSFDLVMISGSACPLIP